VAHAPRTAPNTMPRDEKIELRAGPVEAFLVNGELRYLRFGDVELLRRVYVAVRDRLWRAIPPRISNLQSRIERGYFHVVFTAAHEQGEVDFRWTGTITGEASGKIIFTMDGEAQRDFPRNRIGICALYPTPECAGRRCRIEHTGGAIEEGVFPQLIAPHQPFKNIRAITHEMASGLAAEVRLTGEVFEMEDQRNWTDGSYKIYGTPLNLPFPVAVRKGEKISQSCTLTLQGETPARLSERADERAGAAIAVTFDEGFVTRLPQIGLGAASHGQPLSERELGRLRLLNPSHLRVDLELQRPDYKPALTAAANEARELGAKLEVALFLSGDAAAELRELKREAERLNPPVARWLIFHIAEKVTAEKWAGLAREILANGNTAARIGAGTNLYFTELNRDRPAESVADVICYSINPQVHATDEDTLVESLAAQSATVESARRFTGNAPLAITPVTLRPRFNPHAANEEAGSQSGMRPGALPDALPGAVDVRQMSLFAAAWTLGSLKYLAESGVESVTYYETTGWRGVMETEQGSPEPELFPSLPGSVFPLWSVLAEVGEFAGAEVIRTISSEPLKVISLALRRAEKLRLMLANLSGEPQSVWIDRIEKAAQVRRLNEGNLPSAISTPKKFRGQSLTLMTPAQGGLELTLLPDEIVTLDFL
ncbi:MAG: hypothetical protein ACREEM_46290, partial [Blastocatellia bacterium]